MKSQLTSLNVFDLDDTLLKCFAKVYVVNDEGTKKEIDDETYFLQHNETYDLSEFRSAQLFYETCEPNPDVIERFMHLRDYDTDNSKTIILTARSDFDDNNIFFDALFHHGVYGDDIEVHRSGNLRELSSIEDRKCHVINEYLNTGNYNHIRVFEDSQRNMRAIRELLSDYNSLSFEFWHVIDGQMTLWI